MRFGVHCSIRNGYIGAVQQAIALGCTTMQMFSHSPRVWKFPPPDEEEVEAFKAAWLASGMHPLAVHAAYLPNPATDDRALRNRSVRMLCEEFVLAARIRADYLVLHPGSYSPTSTREAGIRLLAEAIREALSAAPDGPMILVEQVCARGRKLGGSFSEIARIMSHLRYDCRVGLCLDTAHAHASGYDLATHRGVQRLTHDIQREIGLERLRLVHLNDSDAPAGSGIDRHAHIGTGTIGIAGFRRILAHPKFRNLPGILETPKEAPFGVVSAADRRNLSVLEFLSRSIVGKSAVEHRR